MNSILEMQLQNVKSYERSLAKLSKYDGHYFSVEKDEGYDAIIKKDFNGKRIKNGYFKNCSFEGTSFAFTGGAGTRFIGCNFDDCIFNGANFQFCDFTTATFSSEKSIEACNFNQSTFNNATLKHISVKNTSISQAQFIDSNIENVVFEHSTMQENHFKNTYMSNVSFAESNLEYSIFENVEMNNVILPFHQVPYIFGALQHLIDTPNTVQIAFANSQKPPIELSEYLNLMPHFCTCYEEQFEYFPLANIYLAARQYDKAFAAIENGISYCLCMKDFRKLKMLCKLAVQSKHYERKQLLSLYQLICNSYMSIEFSESDRYYYGMHIDEIKSILLNPLEHNIKLHMVLSTNITYKNYDDLGIIISLLEDCMKLYNISPDHSEIDIRHNSQPISILTNILAQNAENVVMCMCTLESIVSSNDFSLIAAVGLVSGVITIAEFIQNKYDESKGSFEDKRLERIEIPPEKISFINRKRQQLKEKDISIQVKLSLLNGLDVNIHKKIDYK